MELSNQSPHGSASAWVWYGVRNSCSLANNAIFPTILTAIPLSLAYATWCGLATALTPLLMKMFFNEYLSLKKAFFLAVIVTGIVGINLVE